MSTDNITVTAGQNPVSTLISFLFTLAALAGAWKMYVKMGEEGWACLIPFYNKYLLFKRCWEKVYYFYALAAIIVGGVTFAVCLMAVFAQNAVIAVCMGICTGIVWLAALALWAMLAYKLSRAFGHGMAFTIGLVLMPAIFVMILGFGDDSYKVDYLNS